MNAEDSINLGLLAAAMGKLASAFDTYNKLYERRLRAELGIGLDPEKKREPEFIYSESEQRREAISDRPSAEWIKETEEKTVLGSRFRERFEQTEAAKQPAPAPRRRVVAVPQKQ